MPLRSQSSNNASIWTTHRSTPYSLRSNSRTQNPSSSPAPSLPVSFLDTLPEDMSVERHVVRTIPSYSPSAPATQQALPAHLSPVVRLAPLSPDVLFKPQFLKKSPFASLTRELNNEAAQKASSPQPQAASPASFQKWAASFGANKLIHYRQTTPTLPSTTTPTAGPSSIVIKPDPLQPINLTTNSESHSPAKPPLDIRSQSSSSTSASVPPFFFSASASNPAPFGSFYPPASSPNKGLPQATSSPQQTFFSQTQTYANSVAASTSPAPSFSPASNIVAPPSFPSTPILAPQPVDVIKETTRKLHSMQLRSHKLPANNLPNTIPATYASSSDALTPKPLVAPPVLQQSKFNISSQQQVTPGSRNQQRPIIPQFPPPPPINSCRGLGTTVSENSFSVLLTDKLEENYLRCRSSVMSQDGTLITPLRFLNLLCSQMGMSLHAESFRFYTSPTDIQFRTELYVGGFCGVGHGLSAGFSRQLAAAHVLERMRIHFQKIKQNQYALYPGGRYTKITEKLEKLCKTYDCGTVQMTYEDRWQVGRRGYGAGRWGNNNTARWRCCCYVKSMVSTADSDHMTYGTYLAQMGMYLNILKPPEASAVQVKDYFGVGADCPMLKDIHFSMFINRPSANKWKWLMEWQVPASSLDAVLHDPMNNSRYLMGRPHATYTKKTGVVPESQAKGMLEGAKLQEFKLALEEALDWIQDHVVKKHGMTLRQRNRKPQEKKRQEEVMMDTGENNAQNVGRAMALSKGELPEMEEDEDENDAEVAEIFHDALMEIM